MSIVRESIVTEARSWLGTPYHHRGNVRGPGGGVDCGWLLIKVYAAVGLIPEFDPGDYSRDWHLHNSAPIYLEHVQRYAKGPVDVPSIGDLVVMRWGRQFAHGGIYIGDDRIIHAYVGRGCDIAELAEWPSKPKQFFTVV